MVGPLDMLDVIVIVAWVLVPLVSVAVDIVPSGRAGHRKVCDIEKSTTSNEDFEILVPIYGSLRYLENVEYLSEYGKRVVLCTSTDESEEFDQGLAALAVLHGFRIFATHVPGRTVSAGRKSVAAPVRDLLVREALATVTATYVVCLDADTITEQPLQLLVGTFAANDLDVASVRLVPSNRNTLLARLQGHEYRMAMRMRRLYPWLVSGACHVARTNVHYEIMQRHSLFFQGNDAELGILADVMGYRVGHIPFDVPTTVPARFTPWWRQRYAWVGGEFRIYFVNGRFFPRHLYFYIYGALIVTLMAPLRWVVVLDHPPVLVVTYLAYVASFVVLNWRTRSWDLLLLPFYSLIGTLVLVPTCVVSYLSMAFAHHNFGVIRPNRLADARSVAALPLRIAGGITVSDTSVTNLQRDLTMVGHSPGRIDGEFGPHTRRALIAWQQRLIAVGFDLGPAGADGVYGPLTANASRLDAPWFGLDDYSIPTDAWLATHRRPLFGVNSSASTVAPGRPNFAAA